MNRKYLVGVGLFFLLLVLAFTQKYDGKLTDNKSISIEKALNEGIISAEFQGTGTYSGDAISLELRSLLSVDTIVKIEAGRRLISDDTLLQDILIVKELELFLAAKEVKRLKLFGFCYQAHNAAPKFDSFFKVGFMEDSSLISLSHFLAKSGLPLNVMQSAIWVVSDDNPLNSVHNDNEKDKDKMKELFHLLAEIKGVDYVFPWYTLKYKRDSTRVFSGKPNRLFAEIEYNLDHQSNVDLFIKDEKDLLVKKLFMNRPHHRGGYSYRFTLDVANMPKGKYYLRLYADNQLKMLKVFEL